MLLGLFSEVHEDNVDKSNKSNDESTDGDGTSVAHESEMETKSDFGFTILFSMGVEVVGGGTDHNNKGAGVLEPGTNPEDTKEHEKEHVKVFILPGDGLTLGDQWISFNFVQRDNTHSSWDPDEYCNNG